MLEAFIYYGQRSLNTYNDISTFRKSVKEYNDIKKYVLNKYSLAAVPMFSRGWFGDVKM